MTEKEQFCSNCRYWDNARNYLRGVRGECHRYPPVVGTEPPFEWSWPGTEAGDWCGEWDHRADFGNKYGNDSNDAK